MKKITTAKNILKENSSILQQYFKEINKYPILTREQEVELANKIQQGDEAAREKLINSNLRFVVTCAKHYLGQGVPLMDLISSGNYGLALSVDKFDPTRGYKFLSLAVWYIRREIIRAICNHGRTIRYPMTFISKVSKVKKAYDSFVSQTGRDPDDNELIKLANLTQKQYDSVVLNKSSCQSFDTPISEDGKVTIADTLQDNEITIRDNFTIDTINKALNILNPREYKVITEFYGLNDVPERSIKDIAREMGLGDERVRQLRKAAIKKLYERCGNILKTLL